MNRAVLFVVCVVVIGAAGLLWLSRGSMMPPAQKVEQTIPDDHIPR